METISERQKAIIDEILLQYVDCMTAYRIGGKYAARHAEEYEKHIKNLEEKIELFCNLFEFELYVEDENNRGYKATIFQGAKVITSVTDSSKAVLGNI